MAAKRRHKRIVKRLATEFSSGGTSFRGTSSNLSEGGLFLRTTKPLPADTEVEVSIQLPDDTVSRLKGTVRWSLKSVQSNWKSGMGIEISENDRNYVDFLNTYLPPEEQIVFSGKKKVEPAPPPAEIEHSPLPVSRSAPQRETQRPPPPIAPPAASRDGEHEADDSAIDSLIGSLFSKRGKKGGQ